MTVFEIIEQNSTKTGNKTGLYAPKIMELTGLDWFDVRKELNRLFKEEKIVIREGINGKLIFKK
jgi:hypothetical protein